MTELHPLYDKSYVCLFCKQSFTSKKIRSRFIKAVNYDTDFCPTYENNMANPLLYYIKVCPHCGFSFSEDFSTYFPPKTMETIDKKVKSQWVSRDFGGERTIDVAIQTLKLAAYCGMLKKEKHIHLAGIYIRIAWLYRTLEKEGQEQRFLKLALQEYIESYTTDDFRGTQMSEVRLLYMIGELYKRTEQMEKAIQYFSKVIEKQKQAIETKIIEMARDRWYEIREYQKSLK